MREKLGYYLRKYREQIVYLIFGVATTAVSFGVFWLFCRILGDDLAELNNAISFVAAAAFAYVTNKIFVFHSRDWSLRFVAGEALSFLSGRVASFALEEGGISFCVRVLRAGRYSFFGISGTMMSKIVLSVVVVILNYFFSKYLVFRKKNSEA